MVELRVPDRMAVLPVVMVVVMALLVVPQAKAQAVELAQMVVIPALVLLTDPEAQGVQQMVAQREALQTEAGGMALDQLEVQVVLTGEQLMVPVPDQREVPQVVQLTVAQVMALATEQVLETAAMAAQEAEMAAEMALATVAPTLTHQP